MCISENISLGNTNSKPMAVTPFAYEVGLLSVDVGKVNREAAAGIPEDMAPRCPRQSYRDQALETNLRCELVHPGLQMGGKYQMDLPNLVFYFGSRER